MKRITDKEKKFVEAYIKEPKIKHKATVAALAAYDVQPQYARRLATAVLDRPKIQDLIREALHGEIPPGLIARFHRRNITQSANLPLSQEAIRDYYKIQGVITEHPQANTNIALVVEK